jgi:hypothetical protein
MPAFHGLLLVRDEADIIGELLTHVLSWCDTLHILDTGSTDGTWEIVREAARDERVLFHERQQVLFGRHLRAWLFDRARAHFRRGDWVVRLDADEFYQVPPPGFVRERVRWPEGRIYGHFHEFVLTASEARACDEGRDRRDRPIHERRTRYFPDPARETRLVRYRRGMRWAPENYEPSEAGFLARECIPIRHYRCRDPEQLRTRCAVRAPRATLPGAGTHWVQPDWRKWVLPDDDPRLRTWHPGDELRRADPPGWIPRNPRRAAQWLYYASGAVNLRDALRPRFPRERPLDPDPFAASAPASVDPAPAGA